MSRQKKHKKFHFTIYDKKNKNIKTRIDIILKQYIILSENTRNSDTVIYNETYYI